MSGILSEKIKKLYNSSQFDKQCLWEEVKRDVSQEEALDYEHHKVQLAWKIAETEASSTDYYKVISLFRAIGQLLQK